MPTSEKIAQAIANFAQKHTAETFYVMGFDAGYIGFNSVEEFEKKRTKYFAEFEKERQPLTVESLNDDQRDDAETEVNDQKVESVEAWVSHENARRAAKASVPNPYADVNSREYTRLRTRPGNWKYQQAIDLGVDATYLKHYALDGKKQDKSEYAKAVKAMLGDINANRGEFLKGLKLSSDFTIITPDHEA